MTQLPPPESHSSCRRCREPVDAPRTPVPGTGGRATHDSPKATGEPAAPRGNVASGGETPAGGHDTSCDTVSRDRDAAGLFEALRLHLALLHRPGALEAIAEHFDPPTRVFRVLRDPERASPQDRALLCSLRPRWRARLLDERWRDEAREELVRCDREGVTVLVHGQRGWPPWLDTPPAAAYVLFVKGELVDGDAHAIAMVGTRRPTPYGARQAQRFGRALAEVGVTVVSGLARGIDVACQRAALEAGGRTVAVLGSGLGSIYPAEHRRLAESIWRSGHGAVVSELPFCMRPRKHAFPRRNRIISALACGVLVLEAGERSGTLHTVDWALDQGRAVFALPGRVDDPEAQGCNRLLLNGAPPVTSPRDLLEASGLASLLKSGGDASRAAGHGKESGPGKDPFLLRLQPLFRERDYWSVDEIAERLGEDPLALIAELTRLEGRGELVHHPGGRYSCVG